MEDVALGVFERRGPPGPSLAVEELEPRGARHRLSVLLLELGQGQHDPGRIGVGLGGGGRLGGSRRLGRAGGRLGLAGAAGQQGRPGE